MYSHMNEVATILGVKIGEYFDIDTKEGKFVFDNNGLYSMHTKSDCPYVLFQLLTGELDIKRQPWKPTMYKDVYYVVDDDGNVQEEHWFNEYPDLMCYKLGNCYRTSEEAEAHRDKWITFYASDDILEV